jgi:hypothetical protein
MRNRRFVAWSTDRMRKRRFVGVKDRMRNRFVAWSTGLHEK